MHDLAIRLDPQGDTATLSLARYLGSGFAAYRDILAAHGARYVPAEKVNRVPVESVPALLVAFRAAGFQVAPDAALAGRLAEKATEARTLLDAGLARLEAAQTRLAGTGLALYPYQRSGVQWLAPRDRALLADDMGLGKTVQALLALPEDAAALVVAPAAVRSVWVAECRRWRPDLSPVALAGKAGFRWPVAGELVVTTYGSLPAETVDAPPVVGTVLLADEAHALKNTKAKRTAAFRALGEQVRAYQGKVWLVTGTPLLNRPPELWSLLQTAKLATEAFGSWVEFVRLFNGRKGRFGYEWGLPAPDVADRLRKVALHRRRVEVLQDLPTKTRQDLVVNGLSAETIRACDAALAALDLDEHEVPELHPGVPAFERISHARMLLAAAKIQAMLEIVEEHEESEEPLVVFACHRAPVDALAQRDGWATITGDTSADERGRIVAAFQAGRLKGIAGTVGAMGVGVTLTRAHRVLMVELDWTPALNCQAEDRVCRIGQDRGVVVLRLIASHPLDQRVVELVTEKQALIEASVESARVDADCAGTSDIAAELERGAAVVADAVQDLEAAELQAKAEREVKLEQARAEARARLGRDVQVDERGRRGPANDVEEHAARAVQQLAACDPDHARDLNGVGFNRFDNDLGHSLAAQLAAHGVLSEKQWGAVVALARRYHRQVGEAQVDRGDSR